MNKINYCLCHDTTMVSYPTNRTSHMQLHEMYHKFIVPISTKSAGSQAYYSYCTTQSGEQTMLDYIGDILSVLSKISGVMLM